MPGRVERWQRRVLAAEKQRQAEDVEVERLSLEFPSEALAPDGTIVSFKARLSGEPPRWFGYFDALGDAAAIPWLGVAWLVHRDGWTIWVTAPGFRSAKYQYSSQISALRDGPLLAQMVQEGGTSALGLRATASTPRRLARQPQDRRRRSTSRREGRHEAIDLGLIAAQGNVRSAAVGAGHWIRPPSWGACWTTAYGRQRGFG